MSIFEQPRWQWIKDEWAAGNKKQAVLTFINGFPNMVYPGGESAYDAMCAEYEKKYGSADDLRAWKNVCWRELWHFVGGVILGIPNIPIVLLGCPLLAAILPSITLGAMGWKEITQDGLKDRGYLMPKDFLDALMWALGASSWLLLLLA